MTNHWSDMVHADVALIMGGNPAENHPISMNWLRRTKEAGAILLHVDPRFTRSSQICDVYAKMRSGTDIAFVGGMIQYALANNRINWDYVRNYTNASWIVADSYDFEDGLFSGYDPVTRTYDSSQWAFAQGEDGYVQKDPTLKDAHCVFQLMRKHYARYDPDAVCNITGTPRDIYLKVCDHYTSTFAPDRAGTWLYAMGTAQSSHGTQNIRTYAILQLLLGNIGIAGGGVNAMRGEANVQGSTDQGLLFDSLPGYLKIPVEADGDLSGYLARVTPKPTDRDSVNWWSNTPKYIVSMLKAWWGEHATRGNDFAFDYLPKVGAGFEGSGYSFIPLFQAMYAGKIRGAFCFGQNPAVGGPNSQLAREALDKLDWLVVADLFEHETAANWMRPGVDPKDTQTEVFLLPAAASIEKEGSIVNSGRWMQWRYTAVPPPGEAIADLDIVDGIVRALKTVYAESGTFPEPIRELAWSYGGETGHVDPHRVAKEINGSFLVDAEGAKGTISKAGTQVPGFAALRDDGSTASGNWLYCGSYTEAGNQSARRDATDAMNGIGLHPNWAWVWPMNRRILYNRCSVDLKGNPYNPRKWVIRWNADSESWEGDVPDGGMAPGAPPYIMLPGGVAQLFAPGLVDGPFPEHYEPVESPIDNPLSSQQINPAVKVWDTTKFDRMGDASEFPIVATTYRVSEHWQTGAMSRNMPWLVGLMPDAFCEIGVDLARSKEIANGDLVKIKSARGEVEVYALVTERFQPFFVGGRTVHQVGIPWHWGWAGLAPGDSANVLTANVGDPNTMIPEYKVFLCDVRLHKKRERRNV
jgi:formate dehydrogenase major subunit